MDKIFSILSLLSEDGPVLHVQPCDFVPGHCAHSAKSTLLGVVSKGGVLHFHRMAWIAASVTEVLRSEMICGEDAVKEMCRRADKISYQIVEMSSTC